MKHFFLFSILVGALLASGCGDAAPPPDAPVEASTRPALETRADSMAMRIYEAHGGPEVWEETPALAFTFAGGRVAEGDTVRQEIARHWWRRTDGQYRVEWPDGPDTTYTAVFDAREIDRSQPPEGWAALNGARLDSAAEARVLVEAQGRFVNDTYWLLVPLKLFDEGVNRTMSADPSREDSTAGPVLHLSFGDVGITSEDEYWLMPDSTSDRLAQWTFQLQGMGPEQAPGVFRWTGYETHDTPAGPLTLATRKENTGGPGIVYTDEIRTPASLPDSLFSME